MQYQPFLFNYNIPAEIFAANAPDRFIEVRAQFVSVMKDGSAQITVQIQHLPPHYGYMVKDWHRVALEIEQIAQQHFQRLVDLDRRLQAEDTLRQINWVEGQDKIAS